QRNEVRRLHVAARLRRLGVDEAARAVVASGIPAGHRPDLNGRSRVRSMNEAAVPDVEPDMAEPIEEDEVAGLERAPRDPVAEVEVGVGAVRQLDSEALVDVTHEAR